MMPLGFRKKALKTTIDRQLHEYPQSVAREDCSQCPSCNQIYITAELFDAYNVCEQCGHHFRLNARQRIALICDAGSFVESDADIVGDDPLSFPGYVAKIEQARLTSHESEAVITGTATIGGHACAVFVMESNFMMGSMGAAVGEKITRVFEVALDQRIPVVGYTVSGGARMQEGIVSLMQMAKVTAAVSRHSKAGLLYVTILTDPTTGGVTASFAMEGDIIISEPGALIAFAGPRVIAQTIKTKLPKGFQRAEHVLESGFLDDVVARPQQIEYLTCILSLHAMPAQEVN